MLRKELIFRTIYFFLSHLILVLWYLYSFCLRLVQRIGFVMIYKLYYLNDEIFFFINHPLAKLPSSIAVFASKRLTENEIKALHLYSSLYGIPSITFISSPVVLTAPSIPAKPSKAEFVLPNSGLSEILSLIKSNSPVKPTLTSPVTSLLLCIGKKGMDQPGLPIRFTYSSELYTIDALNPMSFHKVLQKYSNSEQRNGR